MQEYLTIEFINNIKLQIGFFIVIFCASTLAMIVDLIYGVKKAKERKELRTSEGYKMTVEKGVKYYCLLFLGLCADMITSVVIITPPFFSALFGIYICFIEVKSWMEKAGDKEKRQMLELAKIYLSKKDIIDQVLSEVEKRDKSKNKDL